MLLDTGVAVSLHGFPFSFSFVVQDSYSKVKECLTCFHNVLQCLGQIHERVAEVYCFMDAY